MGIFKRKAAKPQLFSAAAQPRRLPGAGFAAPAAFSRTERRLYWSLRESVPIIDAAIHKLVRLLGDYRVTVEEAQAQKGLDTFLRQVQVGACQQGFDQFLSQHFEQLLTEGTAVGEIVPGGPEGIAALYNAPLDDVTLLPGENPLEVSICTNGPLGELRPVEDPSCVIVSALNPPPGQVEGVSILRGLPFVSGVLMQIFQTVGVNWERVGNVRFAVTYKPAGDAADRAYSKERATQIANEWTRAMQSGGDGQVSDFVSVGDVSIRVIGADNQVLDSEVPVRQLLEQIVAKLSIPPFLLGLSWSSTERMSQQQADILTSELDAYRKLLTPVVARVCAAWLAWNGYASGLTVEWENINLQDEVEHARARLLLAQAAQLEARGESARPQEEGA